MEIILSSDTNAHSPLWGNKIDKSGELLEELLFANQIQLLNRGNKPTFNAKIGKSCIDITGITPKLTTRTTNWTCGQKVSHSDHEMIQFDLKIPLRKKVIKVRSYKNCDWGTFQQSLITAFRAIPIPKIFTIQELDKHANLFHSTIMTVLNKVQPKKKIFKDTSFKWWTDELHITQREVRKLLHRARRLNNASSWNEYKLKVREYRYLLKKAKRESWKIFISMSDRMILQSK
jgi:hypothetical protein